MFKTFLTELRPAIMILLTFTVLTGIIYPLVVTGIGQLLFPQQAQGSLILEQTQVRGSHLLGQAFTQAKYFWGRPSHTASFPYNAASSGASNFGPSNPNLLTTITDRLAHYQQADPSNKNKIPIELLMASGSGLDPQLSPAAAYYQADRVARARGIAPDVVHQLITQHIKDRTFYLLGEPRVNVVALNIALDALK
ncbi:MAG TPA: potassium-transporting ATPase subunit KdpC [Gammaproteobacteria bacterium]|nr:potassium-transporting ATPase subunit KdpC [Gammaproteobacteria bacterium]